MAKEKSRLNDADIDSITTMIEALTINWVKQESINDSKIEKIETDIKELMKVVKELISNNLSFGRSQSRSASFTRPQRNLDNHQYFNCQQEGYISCNCPNQIAQDPPDQRNEQRDIKTENVEVLEANIRYFEITTGSSNFEIECLKVEIVKGEPIFDIKNWELRKKKCVDEEETISYKNRKKKEKVDENKNISVES
ncbi:25019_t:CDS:1 [Dentiscutata erythropus]|uniref:25019_t:CDS:1 n=1 Tax=Dentiscutata erythropus TaxID=1348616 RepID=A0A9N9FCQ2_9GLOM|nr:25019_t:CDS:1 [Dentiscutata erythropus]